MSCIYSIQKWPSSCLGKQTDLFAENFPQTDFFAGNFPQNVSFAPRHQKNLKIYWNFEKTLWFLKIPWIHEIASSFQDFEQNYQKYSMIVAPKN